MKKLYLFIVLLVGVGFYGNAQNTVEFDANAAFLGYANVFELPSNGGAFVFGQAWGVPDLKTVVDAGGGTVTLQPNFNAWGDGTDPFWVDQGTGEGNKIFEGNTYVEDNSLAGEELTFNGYVDSSTIDGAYEVVAFIKVFNGDFSVLKEETVPLVGGQNFSVVFTDVDPVEDAFVQYGCKVTGVNANPADEGTLGSVVVTAPNLGVNDNALIDVSVYPNPAATEWNVRSGNQIIQNVELYNVLGALVERIVVDSNSVSISNESLESGIYLANIITEVGTRSIKLIKR